MSTASARNHEYEQPALFDMSAASPEASLTSLATTTNLADVAIIGSWNATEIPKPELPEVPNSDTYENLRSEIRNGINKSRTDGYHELKVGNKVVAEYIAVVAGRALSEVKITADEYRKLYDEFLFVSTVQHEVQVTPVLAVVPEASSAQRSPLDDPEPPVREPDFRERQYKD